MKLKETDKCYEILLEVMDDRYEFIDDFCEEMEILGLDVTHLAPPECAYVSDADGDEFYLSLEEDKHHQYFYIVDVLQISEEE